MNYLVTMASGFAMLLASCTDTKTAQRVLENDGYENIQLCGWSWLACGKDDFNATCFKATKNGKVIEGSVCNGLFFKNATIRFK